jgi:DNA-binding CsgD family transcriptional regulator
VLGAAGRFGELAAQVPAAVREAELLGLGSWRRPMLTVNLAIAYLSLGRWDEAVQQSEQVLAAQPDSLYEQVLRSLLGSVHLYRGDFGRAVTLIPTSEEIFAGTPVLRTYLLGHVTALWCELAVARQDPESAGPAAGIFLQHAVGPDAPHRPDERGLLGVAMLQRARIAAAPRNRELAADVAAIRATLTGLLARFEPRAPHPAAYRSTITAALGPGRLTDWDQAAEQWRELHHVPGTIDCLIAGAEAALTSNNRAGARRRLGTARDLATPLRATVHLDRIAALGRRARLEPPATKADLHGLTPREYDVLRLLARGLPNRQIAGELFISPATVGVHVSRILAKLNATTRTEATATGRTLGLLP